MKRVRNLFVAGALAAAAVGVIGPGASPATAQCDPGPASIGDLGASSSCSNTCQKLGAAVAKITGQSLWECTM